MAIKEVRALAPAAPPNGGRKEPQPACGVGLRTYIDLRASTATSTQSALPCRHAADASCARPRRDVPAVEDGRVKPQGARRRLKMSFTSAGGIEDQSGELMMENLALMLAAQQSPHGHGVLP